MLLFTHNTCWWPGWCWQWYSGGDDICCGVGGGDNDSDGECGDSRGRSPKKFKR